MKNSFNIEQGETQTPPEAIPFSTLSDKDLIPYCMENLRPAWEEFFRRHIPLIKLTIKRKLIGYGYDPNRGSNDAIWDIHERIVVKLYDRGILSQCIDPDGFRKWLKTIVQNQVTDWVKEQNRNKRLPQKQSQDSMVYFSSPLREGEGSTFEEILADTREPFDELATELENILETMGELSDNKKTWALRLCLISQLPLSDDDLEALARFNGLPIENISHRVAIMQHQVEVKEEKRTEAFGRSVILWHDICRLEYRLSLLEKPSTDLQQVRELEIEIADKRERREKLLAAGKSLIRPANQDIAELIGIPKDKAEQISTFLARARKTLCKKLETPYQ